VRILTLGKNEADYQLIRDDLMAQGAKTLNLRDTMEVLGLERHGFGEDKLRARLQYAKSISYFAYQNKISKSGSCRNVYT